MAGPERRLTSRLVVRAAAGLPDLDAAAVWTLGAIRHLLRRGRGGSVDDGWEWVELFDELREIVLVIQAAKEPPANCCPLVPVWMPVDVDAWPEPGEAIPVEVEQRTVGAIDNRRLVGKVARLLIEQISLHCQAAKNYEQRARRSESTADQEKAARYAVEVRDRGRRALRGVDLQELGRAVAAEAAARTSTEAAARGLATVEPSPGDRHDRVEVQFPSSNLAIVTEGKARSQVRGHRRVWLLRQVVEAGRDGVTWFELLKADVALAGEKLRGRGHGASTPRMATNKASFQRLGRHIRAGLGKLAYLWQQDGRGARWAAGDS